MSFSPSGFTDRYDSALGAYTGSRLVPDGDVGSHGDINTSGSASFKDDATAGGNSIVLPVPPSAYYFSQVILSGGSTLQRSPGTGTVDLHESDRLDLSGGTVVTTSAIPGRPSIWGCGSIVGASVTSSGGSKVHHDMQLAASASAAAPLAGSCLQVAR